MAHKLKNPRAILITGASSGIGEALALAYAKKGVFLALSGRNEERLSAVAAACRALGAEVAAEAIDAAEREAMGKWINSSYSHRALDLVIANAGVSGGTFGRGESEEQVRHIFAVNLAGVLNTVLPAIPLMRERKRGAIAIMSSLAAFRGVPSAPAYAASKAAVRVYGEGLRIVLAPAGVSVSVICPGFVVSRITQKNKFRMPFLMTAEKAAGVIIRGLGRGKSLIAFPFPMYFVMRLFSVLPAWVVEPILKRLPKKE